MAVTFSKGLSKAEKASRVSELSVWKPLVRCILICIIGFTNVKRVFLGPSSILLGCPGSFNSLYNFVFKISPLKKGLLWEQSLV